MIEEAHVDWSSEREKFNQVVIEILSRLCPWSWTTILCSEGNAQEIENGLNALFVYFVMKCCSFISWIWNPVSHVRCKYLRSFLRKLKKDSEEESQWLKHSIQTKNQYMKWPHDELCKNLEEPESDFCFSWGNQISKKEIKKDNDEKKQDVMSVNSLGCLLLWSFGRICADKRLWSQDCHEDKKTSKDRQW